MANMAAFRFPDFMKWKAVCIWLLSFVGSLFFCNDVFSQISEDRGRNDADAKTQIITRPTGAIVSLDGEYDLAGKAPYTVGYYLRGSYDIKAALHGYENWTGHYEFSGQGNEKLSIKLSPKTRLKALWRSSLIPGWGQTYADQKFKGTLIKVVQFAALGTLAYQHIRYNLAVDELEDSNRDLLRNISDPVERSRLQAELNAAQSKVNDRFQARKRWALIAGAIYVYNLLDISLFFPSYRRQGIEVNLSLSSPNDVSSTATSINIQKNF